METDGGRLVELLSVLSEELSHVTTGKEEVDFAVDRFRSRARKRARLGNQDLHQQALDKFLQVNAAVGACTLSIDSFVEHNARVFISKIFERYNRRLDPDLIQIPFDPRQAFSNWRFGPGASYDVSGTHTAEKIGQDMTVTFLAKPLVSNLRVNNAYFRAYDMANGSDGTRVVSGSRMTTVPKNEEQERTIAIEPSGNMALQLSVGVYITSVLKSIGLDISKQQPKNKALAQRGSVDGSFSTIDMSSASDMFSIELVRRLLPEGLFDCMLRLRSPQTEFPDGTTVVLNMMSTMGNGFTFPMMTLIFSALVYANRLLHGGPSDWIDWDSAAVFGDDIIIPTHEAASLIDLLQGCGFVVNHSKSFLSGPFRESCGGDFYLGYDVTPVYLKELTTDSHVYVAINKIFEWCGRHNVLLHQTLTKLRSFINGEFYLVPEWHGDDAGFRTTQVPKRYKFLQPAMPLVREKFPHFGMMLAVGGYILQVGPNLCFLPRPFKTRYRVRKSRLPNGYLDGRDVLRQALVSDFVSAYAFLIRF